MEGAASATAALSGGLLLSERGLVVDELSCFGKVDRRTGLAGGFVVGGEFCAYELEEAAAPVLRRVSITCQSQALGHLLGSHRPAG
jgi:hypothetical protein